MLFKENKYLKLITIVKISIILDTASAQLGLPIARPCYFNFNLLKHSSCIVVLSVVIKSLKVYTRSSLQIRRSSSQIVNSACLEVLTYGGCRLRVSIAAHHKHLLFIRPLQSLVHI